MGFRESESVDDPVKEANMGLSPAAWGSPALSPAAGSKLLWTSSEKSSKIGGKNATTRFRCQS